MEKYREYKKLHPLNEYGRFGRIALLIYYIGTATKLHSIRDLILVDSLDQENKVCSTTKTKKRTNN